MIASVTFTTEAPETARDSYRACGNLVEIDGNAVTISNPHALPGAQMALRNATRLEQVVRVRLVGGTDHGFVGTQQAEYDSLSARGRTAYDKLRWYDDESHDVAFALAMEEHGFKKV